MFQIIDIFNQVAFFLNEKTLLSKDESVSESDSNINIEPKYYIFKGYDNFNSKPLYRVESTAENENEYVGEWHEDKELAEAELGQLNSKEKTYSSGGLLNIERHLVWQNRRNDDYQWSLFIDGERLQGILSIAKHSSNYDVEPNVNIEDFDIVQTSVKAITLFESHKDEILKFVLDEIGKQYVFSKGQKFQGGGKVSRSQRQYNKEVDAYKWFIINTETKKAESGWENKNDADEALQDYDGDSKYKVVAEKTLSKYNIENPKEKWKKFDKGGNVVKDDVYWEKRENLERFLNYNDDDIYWQWVNNEISDSDAIQLIKEIHGVEFNPDYKYAKGGKIDEDLSDKELENWFNNLPEKIQIGLMPNSLDSSFAEFDFKSRNNFTKNYIYRKYQKSIKQEKQKLTKNNLVIDQNNLIIYYRSGMGESYIKYIKGINGEEFDDSELKYSLARKYSDVISQNDHNDSIYNGVILIINGEASFYDIESDEWFHKKKALEIEIKSEGGNTLLAPNGITEKQVEEDYARAMLQGRNKRSEYFQKLHEALLYFEKTKGSKFYVERELD